MLELARQNRGFSNKITSCFIDTMNRHSRTYKNVGKIVKSDKLLTRIFHAHIFKVVKDLQERAIYEIPGYTQRSRVLCVLNLVDIRIGPSILIIA